ncbi:DUF2304 domain-containing protein [Leifsonia sp. YAF41]|uniref:DUF2304 domain-containing protein n=1 Tax=Leifsonia sp. YAF41 TaxID=3233086 RepID=UPI003F9821FF
MHTTSYLLGIAAAVLTLVVVIELLRRRRLRERHAIWWVIAGSLAVLVSVFPSTLEFAAGFLGIEVPTNLVFFVAIAILFLVCLQHSSELTHLEARARDLVETIALVELRLQRVEAETASGLAEDKGNGGQD